MLIVNLDDPAPATQLRDLDCFKEAEEETQDWIL